MSKANPDLPKNPLAPTAGFAVTNQLLRNAPTIGCADQEPVGSYDEPQMSRILAQPRGREAFLAADSVWSARHAVKCPRTAAITPQSGSISSSQPTSRSRSANNNEDSYRQSSDDSFQRTLETKEKPGSNRPRPKRSKPGTGCKGETPPAPSARAETPVPGLRKGNEEHESSRILYGRVR